MSVQPFDKPDRTSGEGQSADTLIRVLVVRQGSTMIRLSRDAIRESMAKQNPPAPFDR
jgi:hypothetical protein